MECLRPLAYVMVFPLRLPLYFEPAYIIFFNAFFIEFTKRVYVLFSSWLYFCHVSFIRLPYILLHLAEALEALSLRHGFFSSIALYFLSHWCHPPSMLWFLTAMVKCLHMSLFIWPFQASPCVTLWQLCASLRVTLQLFHIFTLWSECLRFFCLHHCSLSLASFVFLSYWC